MNFESRPLQEHQGLLKNARIAVLGGMGFIGRALVRRLSEESEAMVIRVIDREKDSAGFEGASAVEFHHADVRDQASIERVVRNCSFVFNLVGQGGHLESMSNPHQDIESNISAQVTILEACKTQAPGAHLIFASTRQVYGAPQCLPVAEHHQAHPLDMNGINKLTAERYHLLYSRMCGINATVLRLTNTYGPGMRTSGASSTFLGAWIRMLLEGDPICIFGDGGSIRDMTHVEDVVDAFLQTASHPNTTINETFNVGAGTPVTLLEIAQKLVALSGTGSKIEFHRFPQLLQRIDIGNYVADATKLKEHTGWSARVPLLEGIQSTLESFGLRSRTTP